MDAAVTADSNSVFNSIRDRIARGVPRGWRLTTLGACFKWSSGGTPKRTDPSYFGGNIPWAVIGDLNDDVITETQDSITEAGLHNSSAKWVESGSVLVAMYGSIGKLAIAGRRLTTNQAIAFTNPTPVDPKYLYYYLLWQRPSLARLGKGATQLNISQTVIKQFPFLLAPPDEQRRIVAEIEKQFSRLDEAVANLKRVKANLKRYKAAVLKAAVEGRLVPPEAEVARHEGRCPETGENLLQRILERRRIRWKGKGAYKEPDTPEPSALPPLPKGWAYATLEQLSDENRAITYGVIKLGDSVAGGVPILRSSDVRSLRIDLESVKSISPSIAAKYRRTFLEGGEVVITVRGTLGGVAVVPPTCRGFNVSREVAMLALVEPAMARTVALFMASPPVQRWLMNRTKGIAYTGINIETLRVLPIGVPPLKEQERIVAEIDRRMSIVSEVEAEVDQSLARALSLRRTVLLNAFGSMSDVCES